MTRDLLSGHWPVVASPEPDELISSWLHRLAFGNGVPPKAFGPALDLKFRRLVQPARSRAAGDRAGSAGPLHGPHARSGRRHDPCRGWGARSFVAVARRSFAAPAGAAAIRLAAILSAMSGRRRATVLPEGMAPGDDDRLTRATGAACSTAARPHGQGLAPFNQASLRPQNDCAPSRLRSRQREGAGSRRGRPTRGRKFGGPRPTRDGRELRPRRRHPRPAREARSAASGGVDGAPMRPIAPAPCLRWPATSIACSPP